MDAKTQDGNGTAGGKPQVHACLKIESLWKASAINGSSHLPLCSGSRLQCTSGSVAGKVFHLLQANTWFEKLKFIMQLHVHNMYSTIK